MSKPTQADAAYGAGHVLHTSCDCCEHAARRISDLERALRPFFAAVYNDNGDVTITTSRIDHDDWFRAYKVYKKTAK